MHSRNLVDLPGKLADNIVLRLGVRTDVASECSQSFMQVPQGCLWIHQPMGVIELAPGH